MGKTETAADLLAARDADFLAFCRQWQRDGKAFLGSADWFEERGMDGQARAWAWAATAKPHYHVKPSYSVYPNWHWWCDGDDLFCALPRSFADAECGGAFNCKVLPTFPAAIAWFLDRWAEVVGTEPVPAESTPADAAARGG